MMHKYPFSTGVYLLETLTSGMYNNPLMIYREYIQNAVDAIDIAMLHDTNGDFTINVELDAINNSILIRDNAIGIHAGNAKKYLNSIGDSSKAGTSARGFRGIGRLGGMAFCNYITFRTTAHEQKTLTIQKWDCMKIRKILSDYNRNTKRTLQDVLNNSVDIIQTRSEKKSNAYFEVLLEGVSSYRNILLDMQKVERYLIEVAPLPYNKDVFKHSKLITSYLSKTISDYRHYHIYLNGKQLYKPYTDEIPLIKRERDVISNVEFCEIKSPKNELLAIGWHGIRKNMRGALNRNDPRGGIKIRVGDILIGDAHLLDNYFRENRFNNYCVGELHVVSDKLIPNGRRDDFVDNEYKSYFYSGFEKVIGMPLSKEIRKRSRDGIQNAGDASYLSSKNSKIETTNSTELRKLFSVCGKCKTVNQLFAQFDLLKQR